MSNPVQAWISIKDSLAVRQRGHRDECPQWLPEARLLRVLPCGHHYAWNVQHSFQRRRGTVLLLSPLDWLLLEIWAEAGIPLAGILRGIDAAFDGNERRPDWPLRQINSLAFCKHQVLRESVEMKEAAVGSHCAFGAECKEQEKTLLIALPPSGKKIFAALQQEEKIERAAAAHGFGIAMTVHPDEYQKHEALQREGIHLEFLDPEPAGLVFYPGSRLAGRTQRRSRQPFIREVSS